MHKRMTLGSIKFHKIYIFTSSLKSISSSSCNLFKLKNKVNNRADNVFILYNKIFLKK